MDIDCRLLRGWFIFSRLYGCVVYLRCFAFRCRGDSFSFLSPTSFLLLLLTYPFYFHAFKLGGLSGWFQFGRLLVRGIGQVLYGLL